MVLNEIKEKGGYMKAYFSTYSVKGYAALPYHFSNILIVKKLS
jgi:hypothetical protein